MDIAVDGYAAKNGEARLGSVRLSIKSTGQSFDTPMARIP